MTIAALECRLLPISMYALGYTEHVAYHRDVLIFAKTPADCAETGHRHSCGCTTRSGTARSSRRPGNGSSLVVPPRHVCKISAERSDAFLSTGGFKGLHPQPDSGFDALVRLLGRKDPSYRT
jgi:hypothetical protein